MTITKTRNLMTKEEILDTLSEDYDEVTLIETENGLEALDDCGGVISNYQYLMDNLYVVD